MNYYDAVCKMEEMGVDPEYMDGWMGGYLRNPQACRSERRIPCRHYAHIKR